MSMGCQRQPMLSRVFLPTPPDANVFGRCLGACRAAPWCRPLCFFSSCDGGDGVGSAVGDGSPCGVSTKEFLLQAVWRVVYRSMLLFLRSTVVDAFDCPKVLDVVFWTKRR